MKLLYPLLIILNEIALLEDFDARRVGEKSLACRVVVKQERQKIFVEERSGFGNFIAQ